MLKLLPMLVLGLVSYRITRFLIIDTFFQQSRDRLHTYLVTRERFNFFFDKLHDLTSCTWCAGFWVCAAVYYVYLGEFSFNRLDILSIFGIAGVQGMIHALEPDDD